MFSELHSHLSTNVITQYGQVYSLMPEVQLSTPPVLSSQKKALVHSKLRPAGPAASGVEPTANSTDPAPVHAKPPTAVLVRWNATEQEQLRRQH